MISALLLSLSLSAHAQPPRLLVVVSIDQMRADYLRRFRKDLRGGLARLAKEGFVYPYAEHPHLPTETAPGHAAILTGRAPREHGIAGTDWWDRDRREMVSSADDPVHGRGPAQLLSYTVGDALKAWRPGAKVLCLGQKDRTAILLCGKKPDLAVWYDKSAGRFTTSPYYGRVPEWVEAFNAERLIDREYSKRLPGGELTDATTTFWKEITYLPFSDDLVLELAERALQSLELGADETPDLLALGFGANDYAGHLHGPDSPELRATILNMDRNLGRLLALLESRVPGRFALVLTADHGIPPDPDKTPGYRRLPSKRLDEAVESGLRARYPLPPGAKWVELLRSPHVYLDRALAASRGVDLGELRAEAARLLAGVSGILAAYTADEIGSGTLAGKPFAEAVRRSYYPARSGDVLFVLDDKTQLNFGDGHSHNHGSPHPHDARVPLVWYGMGARKGKAKAPAVIYDVAPTAAALLEVPFEKGIEGRVLAEALRIR